MNPKVGIPGGWSLEIFDLEPDGHPLKQMVGYYPP